MRDRAFLTLLRLLPKSALSSAVGLASRAPAPRSVHRLAMRTFAWKFRVDLEEAELPLSAYGTFAQFFTRRLRPGARPIDLREGVLVSPVDGVVSQLGEVEAGECLQAKGIRFSVERLLDDEEEASQFEGGAFATFYLSPRDYHRIHAPLEGAIQGYTYLPGQLWPVSPVSVRSKRALFCLNERLVTYFATPAGRMALVAVGATCVARIRASYDQLLTHQGGPRSRRRYSAPIPVAKGEEIGQFEMGSTVILLFQRGRARWDSGLSPGAPVRLGRRIGEIA